MGTHFLLQTSNSKQIYSCYSLHTTTLRITQGWSSFLRHYKLIAICFLWKPDTITFGIYKECMVKTFRNATNLIQCIAFSYKIYNRSMHVILINTASYLHVYIYICSNAIYLSNMLYINLSRVKNLFGVFCLISK